MSIIEQNWPLIKKVKLTDLRTLPTFNMSMYLVQGTRFQTTIKSQVPQLVSSLYSDLI